MVFYFIFFKFFQRRVTGVIDKKEVAIAIYIVVLGLIGSISTTYVGIRQIKKNRYFAPPCYVDIREATETVKRTEINFE